MKRKSAKKLSKREAARANKAAEKPATATTQLPAFLMKALAAILSVIMIIALTLYVLGRMPARGFFVLTILLAVVAFIVLPAMRKKFAQD
jgi:hypothetical protein